MTEGPEGHACRYAERLTWSPWSRAGALAERVARRVAVCRECGRERPSRRPRPAVRRELRAELTAAPPLADAAGRTVAAVLVRRAGGAGNTVSTRGPLAELARRGIPASLAEEWIERFLRAGWLTAGWTLGPSPRLATLALREPRALAELARPGEDDQRAAALDEARARTAPLSHPKAVEIAALLAGAEAESFPPPLLQALAALAVHAESGEALAERVFAARHLGGSKALAPLRGRLERLVGPLAAIGIREGAKVVLVGGTGALDLAAGRLDLAGFPPFVGLSRETLDGLAGIVFPAAGLFVVENLAVFEACCRGEVPAARGALVAWSAGYPGPPIRRLVELAGGSDDQRAAPLSIWADLDLDGVRIARLLAAWYPGEAAFIRMSPEDLAAAPRHLPLSRESAAAIRRDLAERPEAPLADTLRAMLDSGSWVEQETFLASGRT